MTNNQNIRASRQSNETGCSSKKPPWEQINWKKYTFVCCVVIHPRQNTPIAKSGRQKLLSYLEDRIEGVTSYTDNNILLYMSTSCYPTRKELRAFLADVQKFTVECLDFSVEIGVGNSVTDKEGALLSYENAKKALEMKFLFGSNLIYFYSSIYMNQPNGYPFHTERQILDSLEKRQKGVYEQYIKVFMQKSEELLVTKNLLALLLSLRLFSIKRKLDLNRIFIDDKQPSLLIQQTKNNQKLSHVIPELCSLIVEQLEYRVTENEIVNAAIYYIRQNYRNELTLSTAAEKIFITPGYLSTIFKQVTGQTFVSFLKQVRIEQACYLLKTKNLKTYEVAHQVGIFDEKYFNKVFKKYTGVSPGVYKKLHRLTE